MPQAQTSPADGRPDLVPLLTSPFGLAFLEREPAETGRVAEVYRKRLRTAVAESARVRDRLHAKKISQVKRRELLLEKQRAGDRINKMIGTSRLGDGWIAELVADFRTKGEEVERGYAAIEGISRRFSFPPKELRRLLREARSNENAALKLARKLEVPREEVARLDEEVMNHVRTIGKRVSTLGIQPDMIRRLLRAAQEWEARRVAPKAPGVRLSRSGTRGSVALDVGAIMARADELAERAQISTDLPSRARLTTNRPGIRRVALVPRAIDGQQEHKDLGQATYSDLGRAGEALVFAIMRNRWEAASICDPDRTATLLRRIAANYWATSSEQLTSLDAVLSEPPETWLGSSVLRDLLWPAQTAFGDAMGFDVFGLNERGDDLLCVEVKTTLGPAAAQFEVTANELERARREGPRYAIARVANLSASQPAIYLWRDPAALVDSGELRLTPTAFSVSLG